MSDTKVHGDAKWLYQVVVNLADSRYTGQGLTSVTADLTANWGAIFYIVDSAWRFITGAGALLGANVEKTPLS